MVNPISNSQPAYSQYDIETWAFQQRWANPNPQIPTILSSLPSPFEVAKTQNSNASRKKQRSKKEIKRAFDEKLKKRNSKDQKQSD
jgi:hypothetical protein